MLLNDIVKSTIATITASNETASVTLQSEIVPMCQEDIDFLQSSFKGKRAPSFCVHMAHPNGRVCGAKRPKCEAERSHHL